MHPFVYLSIWLYTALKCRSSISSNSMLFHTSGGISSGFTAFLYVIFHSTELSTSCVICPSLTPGWSLIFFVIGSCVTFGDFPSKFSKCFHWCIRSSWLASFSLNSALLFLLPSSFNVCHAILHCLSSTEILIYFSDFVCILFVLLG